MRIIAGRFKGRQLAHFKAEHIRPTTDRVKETVFNILMHEIADARVLDLFSGTGNLALEALSRGARMAECVENNKKSLSIIRANLKLLGLEKEAKLVAQDVFKYLKGYRGEGFQVIFIDPPFTQKWAHDCMVAVSASKVLTPETRIMIEASRQEQLNDAYGPLQLLDRRDFGDKSALFFQLKK